MHVSLTRSPFAPSDSAYARAFPRQFNANTISNRSMRPECKRNHITESAVSLVFSKRGQRSLQRLPVRSARSGWQSQLRGSYGSRNRPTRCSPSFPRLSVTEHPPTRVKKKERTNKRKVTGYVRRELLLAAMHVCRA